MLTWHWLMNELGVLRPCAAILLEPFTAGVISIDSQPVHDAAMRNLQLAHDRDVVLRLASDNTGAASCAYIQIDAHPPLLRRGQRRMRVNARRRMRQFFFAWNFLREIIVRAIAFERRFADKTAALDAEMLLHNRERVSASDPGHAYAVDPLSACDGKVRICGCAKEISIEAGLLLDLCPLFEIGARIWQFVKLRHLSRPTQRNCNRIVRVPGRDQRRNDQLFHLFRSPRSFAQYSSRFLISRSKPRSGGS